jgi:hypothetical protein
VEVLVRSSLIVAAVCVLCAPAIVALQTPQAPAAPRPNVILIMSDDMGYGDLSSYGGRDIKTPNIDSIGRDGTVSPTATPTVCCAAPRARR